VVYNNVVARKQIYLGDEEVDLLARAELETGASRSELIRRAIRFSYGAANVADRVGVLRTTSGAWKSRQVSGADQVESLRGDLDERLKRLGL